MKITLDHINILAEDWDKTVQFYHDLFGFVEGKDVSGGRKNYLYTEDQTKALIHLTSIRSKEMGLADPSKPHQVQATVGSQNENTGALDHIAFALSSHNFEVLLQKLDARQIQYRISHNAPRQMWFFDPNGVKLEMSEKL